MSSTVFFIDEIRQDQRGTGFTDFFLINDNRVRAVGHVALEYCRVNVAVIGNDKVDDLVTGLTMDGLDVVGHGIVIRFALLSHDVANINFRSLAVPNRSDDIGHTQIRHDARIKASRPQDDGIGTFDGVDSRLDGLGMFRRRKDALDTAVTTSKK